MHRRPASNSKRSLPTIEAPFLTFSQTSFVRLGLQPSLAFKAPVLKIPLVSTPATSPLGDKYMYRRPASEGKHLRLALLHPY